MAVSTPGQNVMHGWWPVSVTTGDHHWPWLCAHRRQPLRAIGARGRALPFPVSVTATGWPVAKTSGLCLWPYIPPTLPGEPAT
jgi:hypothetical protein